MRIPPPTRALPALLLVGALVACSPEGADAPTDAAVEDFCSTMGDVDLNGSARDFSSDLADVGTPAGIPDDARAGFEVMIDESDADEISAEDQEKVTALIGYVVDTCGGVPGS